MNLKTLLPILAVSVVPVSASVIFIDDFNTIQGTYAGLLPNPVNPLSAQTGVSGASNVLGGARSLEVTRTAGTSLDFATVGSGALTMALAPADSGFVFLIWDGDTDGTVNEDGTGSTDLTDSGANTHIALSVRSDLVAPITLTFYSGNGNSSSYTFNTPALGFGTTPFTSYIIAMSSFTNINGGGANFANITAGTMLINGQSQPGLDVEIQNYRAMNPVPEPSTIGLIGAGLIGLAFIRRRKK